MCDFSVNYKKKKVTFAISSEFELFSSVGFTNFEISCDLESFYFPFLNIFFLTPQLFIAGSLAPDGFSDVAP